jgi:hypothetical protein
MLSYSLLPNTKEIEVQIEHTLIGVKYGVGRAQVPVPGGGTEVRVFLRLSNEDDTESWVVPMSEKVADDIAGQLGGSKLVKANLADISRLK